MESGRVLIVALSAYHQLWYLHLCADAGIVVVAYSDDASGVEIEQATRAVLTSAIAARNALAFTAARHKRLDLLPLIIPNYFAFQS